MNELTVSIVDVLFLICLGVLAGYTLRHLVALSDKKWEREQRAMKKKLDSAIDAALELSVLPTIRMEVQEKAKLVARCEAVQTPVQAYVRELILKDLENKQ
jgi:hypothetical protein